jgi:uroporphyrin-III C-methyltransferase
MRKSKVTLVGAGPGDPELITVKGLKALADADVVLYDALIHPDILKYAPAKSIKIFVGKKKGVCQFPQEEINRLLVEQALENGHVVRLKGGDPFIFGRGHEELVYAESFNIETEVIPGISSSIAVPELQRIPLTRRGINDSFWVLTGTTRDHQLSEDIKIAAQSNATVVILMGMSKLEEITQLFKAEGKQNLPVAVIQNGSMEDQRYVLGTISSIVENVREHGLSSPAVIVIGEVVSLHPEFIFEQIEKVTITTDKITAKSDNGSFQKIYNSLFKWK